VALIILAAVIGLAGAWVGVSYAIVGARGPVVTEERRVSGFTKVEIHGAGTLIITQGSTPGLVVEARRGVLGRLTTAVSGSTLTLKPHGVWYAPMTYSGIDHVTYRLTVTDLAGIEAHGAADIQGQQALVVKDFELSTSGATTVKLELNGQTVTVLASGAGDVTLSGSAEVLSFKSSGAAKLRARGLQARMATIDCSGAGRAEIDVSEQLNVNLSGAGHVSYAGDPKVTKSISGAGEVARQQ
jgi:hypothetical protein